MKPLESYEENKVVAWARRNKVLTTKLKTENQRGWPDRAFWLPGYPIIIEFKRRGEAPRKLQRYIMSQLIELQYDVIWVDNAEEAIAYLELRLRGQKAPEFEREHSIRIPSPRLSKARSGVVSKPRQRGYLRRTRSR